ncbi:heavy-metal-associated domain-containing protein [Flagellimonas sp. DF-77]|uniref:heavy-metal-associated domain-containing protein n=1 Tax=Flagellimonas algarum TaxID=3230298 RepID=UPI003391076B
MKHTIFTLALALSTVVTFAQQKNKKMAFEVDGNCEMCKMRIEKAALEVAGVKFADWNIPSHELTLIVDERKTNAMAIKSAIAAVGHDTKELKATEEAYNKVHPCCRYRDGEPEKHEGHH